MWPSEQGIATPAVEQYVVQLAKLGDEALADELVRIDAYRG